MTIPLSRMRSTTSARLDESIQQFRFRGGRGTDEASDANGQVATRRHRFQSIFEKTQEHLLELPVVRFTWAEHGLEIRVNRHLMPLRLFRHKG